MVPPHKNDRMPADIIGDAIDDHLSASRNLIASQPNWSISRCGDWGRVAANCPRTGQS
jgi:hypothetical protein